MVKYDVFVHPGFAVEERGVCKSPVFRAYCDRLFTIASSAQVAIHVIDPVFGKHDAFLEEIISEDRRVRSYVLGLPFAFASYGTVCTEDWDKFLALLRGIQKHRDPVRVHGSYHGVCVLDFAVQLYELVYNHKQYLSDQVSCILQKPFPFHSKDMVEIVDHALYAHYLSANIRFGTVFANNREFEALPLLKKSIVRQMTDQGTKVYYL